VKYPTEDGLEIVEISALDHFNAILKEAQRVAAKAEKEKAQNRKRPVRYSGNSKRMLKCCKNCREDLAKQGYLSVFNFITHVKAKTAAKVDNLAMTQTTRERPAASVIEIEESSRSEESASVAVS
jgi:hypothetical protein